MKKPYYNFLYVVPVTEMWYSPTLTTHEFLQTALSACMTFLKSLLNPGLMIPSLENSTCFLFGAYTFKVKPSWLVGCRNLCFFDEKLRAKLGFTHVLKCNFNVRVWYFQTLYFSLFSTIFLMFFHTPKDWRGEGEEPSLGGNIVETYESGSQVKFAATSTKQGYAWLSSLWLRETAWFSGRWRSASDSLFLVYILIRDQSNFVWFHHYRSASLFLNLWGYQVMYREFVTPINLKLHCLLYCGHISLLPTIIKAIQWTTWSWIPHSRWACTPRLETDLILWAILIQVVVDTDTIYDYNLPSLNIVHIKIYTPPVLHQDVGVPGKIM